VASFTENEGSSLSILDTVAWEKPAFSAISLIVAMETYLLGNSATKRV